MTDGTKFIYFKPLSSSQVRMPGYHPVLPGSNPGNGVLHVQNV